MTGSIVMGAFMLWLFSKFAKRDSDFGDKSYESKGAKITRIVLMCIWGLCTLINVLGLVFAWNSIRDNQKVSYASSIMLGLSLFYYELTLRQSPRGVWVKIRKIIAYILISALYIGVWPTTLLQFTTFAVPGLYGNAIGYILGFNTFIYGISILIIWLLLKPYKRDRLISYHKRNANEVHSVIRDKSNLQDVGNLEVYKSKQGFPEDEELRVENNQHDVRAGIDTSKNLRNEQPSEDAMAERLKIDFARNTRKLPYKVLFDKTKYGMKSLFKFLKRIWKWFVGGLLLAMLIVCGFFLYYYLHNNYFPKKKLDKAVADIVYQLKSNESNINVDNYIVLTNVDFAYNILTKNYDWGYENISYGKWNGNQYISMSLIPYREEAFSLIEQKACQGDAIWQFLLGGIYYYNKDFETFAGCPYIHKNEEMAAYWWLESAINGHVQAFDKIGICYKNGIGVKKNLSKAIEWLRRGAEAGESCAQKHYGDLFYFGGQNNRVLSTPRLKKNMFEHYFGSFKDWDEYRKLRMEGYNDSQIDRIYRNVIFEQQYGTRLDYNSLKSMSPEKRDQYLSSDFNKSIPIDIEQAKYWWKKSAAQGNKEAKEQLQKIYE